MPGPSRPQSRPLPPPSPRDGPARARRATSPPSSRRSGTRNSRTSPSAGPGRGEGSPGARALSRSSRRATRRSQTCSGTQAPRKTPHRRRGTPQPASSCPRGGRTSCAPLRWLRNPTTFVTGTRTLPPPPPPRARGSPRADAGKRGPRSSSPCRGPPRSRSPWPPSGAPAPAVVLHYPTSILNPLPSNAHVCSRYFLFKKFVNLLDIFVSESVKSFEVCDRQQHRRFGDDDDEREKGGRGRAVPQQELHPALETREHPMPRRALA